MCEIYTYTLNIGIFINFTNFWKTANSGLVVRKLKIHFPNLCGNDNNNNKIAYVS